MHGTVLDIPRSDTSFTVDGGTLSIYIDSTNEYGPSVYVDDTTLVVDTGISDGRNHASIKLEGTFLRIRDLTWYQRMIDEVRKYIPFAYIATEDEVAGKLDINEVR